MSFEDHLRKNKNKLKLKEVSPGLWDKIDSNLPTSKVKSNSQKATFGLLVVLLFSLIAYFVYQNHQQQKALKETQQELYAIKSSFNELMKNESSFKRIKALNISNSLVDSDADIINTMIQIMGNDSNLKVRLAAVNALEKFSNEELVKQALINELKLSKEPFFQIKIINILSTIKEERAIPLLNQIIDDKASQSFVKEEAISARKSIKSL